MIELENGMGAKDYRQSINKNFEEVVNTINELLQKINTSEKTQKIITNDIDKLNLNIENLNNTLNRLQNTTKDLYKYIDIKEVNTHRHIDFINKEINDLKKQQKKEHFWQFWKGK